MKKINFIFPGLIKLVLTIIIVSGASFIGQAQNLLKIEADGPLWFPHEDSVSLIANVCDVCESPYTFIWKWNNDTISDNDTITVKKGGVYCVEVLCFNGCKSIECVRVYVYAISSTAIPEYWVGGQGNWNDPTHWSTVSGGPGGAGVPNMVTTVIFDANSFTGPGQMVTINEDASCFDMDWTGVTNNPTLAGPTEHNLTLHGSLTFSPGMSYTFAGKVFFEAYEIENTIFTGGIQLNMNHMYLRGHDGGWTLQDGLNIGDNTLNFLSGNLNTNDQPLTAGCFKADSMILLQRNLELASSVIALSSPSHDALCLHGYGMTLDAGTSLIKLTGEGSGIHNPYDGGLVLNNLICEATTGNVEIFNKNGSFQNIIFNSTDTNKLHYTNTANNIIFDGRGEIYDHENNIDTIVFNNSAKIVGDGIYNNVTMNGDGAIIGKNTFGTLIFTAGNDYTLTSGQSQIITDDHIAIGTETEVIDIKSSVAGYQSTFSKSSGIVVVENVTLQDIKATGGATFYAINSVDNGNNTGWIFGSSNDSVIYKDLWHFSLGSANLAKMNDDTLILINIPSDGEDGLLVDVSTVQNLAYWQIETEFNDSEIGSTITIQAIGTVSSSVSQVLSTASYQHKTDSISALVDLTPLGTTSVLGQFFIEGNLVHEEIINSGSFSYSIYREATEMSRKKRFDIKEGGGISFRLFFPKSITTPNENVVLADAIIYEPIDANQGISYEGIEFKAAGIPSIAIVDEYFLTAEPLGVDLTVFLEGPYNITDMNTTLNDIGILPLNQPYNTAPWHYSGIESVASIPNPDIVDWVLLELRDAADASLATPETNIAQQAAFLLENGSIVGTDGSSVLRFDISITQQLFVVVYHRNHLGIMSSNALTESEGIYTYDFTPSNTQAFGTDAQKFLGNGIYGMYGGDGNADGSVAISDKDPLWELEAGTQGYIASDYNLDRHSNNLDKDDIWNPNFGSEGQVPGGDGFVFNEVTNPATGKTWMDRNLGATQVATSSNDTAAYGDIYQWGRLSDGHENRTSGTNTTQSTTDVPGHSNFILQTSIPFDWRNPHNDNLWQGVSGTNNPCPSGFRLPTDAEWWAEIQSWDTEDSAGAFGSVLKLTVSGQRNESNGSLEEVGSFGHYWSSGVSMPFASNLFFGISVAAVATDWRANGKAVRCIKD